ncbi:MAG: hypothetical protein ABMA26_12315 [Limisphaerales bacterium]
MLPDHEWKWPTPADGVLADWELNVWLNYEFARSYRPMVQWVQDLRVTKMRKTHQVGELPTNRREPPRFATFLTKRFPEFPRQPWLKIPPSVRATRLEQMGISKEISLFDQETAQEIDLDIYSYRTAMGDCDYDPRNLDDAAHLMVKINYRRTNKQILRRLAKILAKRRRQLKELHAEKVLYHAKAGIGGWAPPDPTDAVDNRVGVGQQGNAREFFNRMSELSTLRLWVHYGGNLDRLQEASGLRRKKSNWQKPKNAALDMMVRLHDAWKSSFFPPWVMEPLSPKQITVPRSSRLHTKLPRPEGVPATPDEQIIEGDILRVPGCLK